MNKNNPFEGKAVKFDTAEQLEHLAELARGCKLKVERINYNEYAIYFRHTGHDGEKYYTNCWKTLGHDEIHYSDFIKNIEAAKFTESITRDVPDPIARPEHYRKCSIEPIQIWRELSLNPFMSNVVKYLMRLGHKDAEQDELTKAIQYLNEEIHNIQLGILQFTPKDAKCSVSADVIAKELGMSYPVGTAFHVVMHLHTFEDKIPALQTAINCLYLEISNAN